MTKFFVVVVGIIPSPRRRRPRRRVSRNASCSRGFWLRSHFFLKSTQRPITTLSMSTHTSTDRDQAHHPLDETRTLLVVVRGLSGEGLSSRGGAGTVRRVKPSHTARDARRSSIFFRPW